MSLSLTSATVFVLHGFDPLIKGNGLAEAAAQCSRSRQVEVFEELSLPCVPDLRAGAANIRHGEQVKIVQVFLVTHGGDEFVDNLGVADVFALCRPGHE